MYDDVLIATDGSEATRGAVTHGLGLAEQYGARVHALSVIDTGAVGVGGDDFDITEEVASALAERGRQATEAIGQRAAARGLESETAVVRGAPARQIRRYADENGIDMIAMGTRGRSGLARRMLGSVAGSVLRAASQPVLTANQTVSPDEPSYESVLLPTDGGTHAARVAEHAFDIADRYGATVHALSVIDSSLLRSQELLAALERESESALATVRERGNEAGVDVTTSVWRGTPHDCITAYAERRSADLVVMGAHERRGLDRFLTQQVAERVVRTAPCPVCTLRE